MTINSVSLFGRGRSRTCRTFLAALGAALALLPGSASAQFATFPSAALALQQEPPQQIATFCGPEVKEAVAIALSDVATASVAGHAQLEKELYDKYQFCIQDAQLVSASSTFHVAARECGATVSNLGSIFFEEMSCVGYDPQRRQFAAPIKIKQTWGYGAAALPGSREHVLHCVADSTNTLVPVARDTVHLANAIGAQSPTWQFAVIASANQNLQTIYPMNGQTRRARSILSWAFAPTDCNFTPIWGNALNYRIRLDQ